MPWKIYSTSEPTYETRPWKKNIFISEKDNRSENRSMCRHAPSTP